MWFHVKHPLGLDVLIYLETGATIRVTKVEPNGLEKVVYRAPNGHQHTLYQGIGATGWLRELAEELTGRDPVRV